MSALIPQILANKIISVVIWINSRMEFSFVIATVAPFKIFANMTDRAKRVMETAKMQRIAVSSVGSLWLMQMGTKSHTAFARKLWMLSFVETVVSGTRILKNAMIQLVDAIFRSVNAVDSMNQAHFVAAEIVWALGKSACIIRGLWNARVWPVLTMESTVALKKWC